MSYAFRSLRRNPGFAAVVILTLALGIGANTAMFSVVNTVLLRPLPYENGDAIMVLRQSAPGAGSDDLGLSPVEVGDFRDQATTLDGVVEYHSMNFTLLGGTQPRRVQTGVVSWNFFDVLGVKPSLGRAFRAADETHGADAVLLVSYEFWKSELGADPQAVGRRFEMNDRVHTVIGVLPPLPRYPDANDVFMPTVACPFRSRPDHAENRQMRMVSAFARVKAGVPLAQAQSDVAMVANRLRTEYADAYPHDSRVSRRSPAPEGGAGALGPTHVPGAARHRGLRPPHRLRQRGESHGGAHGRPRARARGAGGARGRSHPRSCGSSSRRARFWPWPGESSASFSRSRRPGSSGPSPRASPPGPPSCASTRRCSPSPWWCRCSRGCSPARCPACRPGNAWPPPSGRAAGRPAEGEARAFAAALVVSQLALSFVLLIGAALMLRSFAKLRAVDAGFRTERVLTAGIDLNWSRYTVPEKGADHTRLVAFHQALQDRLRSLPGVVGVAAAWTFPLNARFSNDGTFLIEGRPRADGQPLPRAEARGASPDYFQALGVPVIRGRSFDEHDEDEHSASVVVVSQALARRNWGDDDPLGHRLSGDDGKTWSTVIGVVGDMRNASLEQEPKDTFYIPFMQFPGFSSQYFLRTVGDPILVEREFRQAVLALDGQTAVHDVRTLEQVRDAALSSPRLTTVLLGGFAALALAITAAGLSGLIAYSVSQRTHEIGIRMALGAEPRRVVAMLLGQGMRPVALGLALGTAGALALARLVSGLLFGIAPTDVACFVGLGARPRGRGHDRVPGAGAAGHRHRSPARPSQSLEEERIPWSAAPSCPSRRCPSPCPWPSFPTKGRRARASRRPRRGPSTSRS